MTYLQAIILGLVQGLGEFLPISSSAHLVIMPWFFDFKDPGLTFNVALHFGTLLAIIAYFWRDWVMIFSGSFRVLARKKNKDPHLDIEDRNQFYLLILLGVATVPGALAGLFLEDYAETVFRSPLLIALNMALLGALLFLADYRFQGKKDLSHIGFVNSLLIGLSQALALVPGVSRSGITMTVGLFSGFTRVTAARFSFLMAAPITLGACILKAPQFFETSITGQALTGILVSAISGFLSIKYLLKYVRIYNYRPFVYYRFIFAIGVVGVYFLRSA